MVLFEKFHSRMRGACPVIEVPFDAAGRVDNSSFDRLVGHVLAKGVGAAVFPAFASEFYKLSDAERFALRRRFLEQVHAHAGVLAVVGVSQHATVLAVKEAVAAAEEGAGAINLLPPHFLRPPRSEVLGHLRAVLAAVPGLPVIIQHVPALAASPLEARDLCALAGDHPNLRMVKVETQPPGPLISDLASGHPPLPAMVGYAGMMMIDALRRGAVGVQPGCSFIEIYQRIVELWQAGKHEAAESLHRRLLPYVVYWMQDAELIIQVEKTISRARGLIDNDHCRAPGRVLDGEERAGVERFLSEFREFFEGGGPDVPRRVRVERL